MRGLETTSSSEQVSFLPETEICDCIRCPFNNTALDLDRKDMEKYIEFSCTSNGDLKLESSCDNLIKCWVKVQRDCPDITHVFLKIPLFDIRVYMYVCN